MDGPGRLAEYVWKRRTELGLSRPQVRDRGGPSIPTLKDIEEGTTRTVSATTLGKLDTALEWEPGSASDVLRGGTPKARRGNDGVASLGPDGVAVALRVVLDLLGISRDLDTIAREVRDARLEELARRLAVALRPMYGEYVTRLFEENKRENGSLSPMYAVFSELLDEPAGAADDEDGRERLYRRWLAGRDIDSDQALLAEFEARFSRRQQ